MPARSVSLQTAMLPTLLAAWLSACASAPEARVPVTSAAAPVASAEPATPPSPPSPATQATAEAPSPIAPTLPEGLEGQLDADVTCKATACTFSGLHPSTVTPAANSPLVAWSHTFENADSSLRTTQDARIDVYGVVVKGELRARGAEETRDTTLGVWGAFHAPGGAIWLRSVKPGTRVVLAVVSDGQPLSELRKASKGTSWRARPGRFETRDLTESAVLSWAGGAMHARIGFEGAGQRASLGLLMASGNTAIAPHRHDEAWELLVPLDASGTLRLGEQGDVPAEMRAVSAGQISVVERGREHEWLTGKDRPLVGVQLYAPPGPEQRFKSLSNETK